MKRLIAVLPILFESRNYEPGDALPMNDIDMAAVWIKSGSAVMKDDREPAPPPAKASPAAAPAGMAGDAYPSVGSGVDLIGKPPPRSTRSAPPEPAKGRRKSSA